MLSAAQMGRMSRLLDEALELDPAGRRTWLEALAPEYQDLLPALRRALLPDGTGGAEASLPLPEVGIGAQAPEVAALKAGDRVGPYQLVRELGSGGMAEVWLAQRADGAFKREVALKLPMLSRLRKDLASRFARERDILAALEHPNIARLYDAGVSAEGLPYLAMEYVHGQPLTTWFDAHRLGIRERLKLFLPVLDAVQYAHGRQVIHRDIKPSNILVSDSGQVRLLDFGVAKLLAQENEQTELTQLYGRALTPEYASPELVRGDAIDAAADVYSLGVVLYELLCGSRPYRLKAGSSMALLEQAIATAQVERPSTQLGADAGTDRSTTQDKLAKRLRGDLDAIVLKALAKAPKDRYGSAAALAEDLQRYLCGEPVEARPPHPTYLLTKFLLRHPAGTAAVTVAVILIAAAFGYALTRSPRAEPVTATNTASSALGATTAPADGKAIAVLRFSTSTLGDLEKWHMNWFARDLTVALGRALAHFGWPVIASHVSSPETVPAEMLRTSRELNARYLIDGVISRKSGQIAVDMQIVDGSTGRQAWTGRIETPEERAARSPDLLLLRATAVLRQALYKIEERRIVSEPLQALNPTELIIRADAIIVSTDQDRDTVDRLYTQARSRAPNLVPALVGEANRLSRVEHLSTDTERSLQDADDLSRRAIALAPDDALAWYVRGWILWHQYRFDAALAANAKSIQLDPSIALSYVSRAVFTLSIGQPENALPMLDLAREIDSNVDGVAFRVGCRAFLSLGRYDEAVQSCERAMATDESWLVHLYLTAAYAQKGDMARAADAKARLLSRKPGFTLAELAEPKNPPDAERFREQWEKHITAGLRKAGIPER